MKRYLFGAALAVLSFPAVTLADDSPLSHAPIGVMADHRHEQGEVMVSYRFMHMDMGGNRDGTHGLSADTIVTTYPNRFFGAPMQPPTLRVVPLEMTMDMHMLGAMYGLTDRITLMGMANYVSKDMDHLTYQGGAGTTELGEFTTSSEGFGDTTLMAIIGLDNGSDHDREINLNLGVSLPTGSTTETGQILTPMNMTPSPRLPYAMQLGSGTLDLKPGITWSDRSGDWGYGAQASAVIRTGDDNGYTLGDRYEVTGWLSRQVAPALSLSARLKAVSQDAIDGIDPAIAAPVQTADPANYGGDTVEALFGFNWSGQTGPLAGHRIAAEVGFPLSRDLNGPQMETDMTFTLGWQKVL